MAFESVASIVRDPVRTESLTVTLQYSYEDDQLAKSAKFRIEVTDNAGRRPSGWVRTGDLVPYLTATQVTGLTALMDNLWTQAQAVIPEVIPSAVPMEAGAESLVSVKQKSRKGK